MSAELTTLAIAASPFFELRGAIPLGIFAFDLMPLDAYILGVTGSFLPVLPLLFFWNFIYEKITHRFYFLNRFFAWLFERTRTKHGNHFETWKKLGLMIFVGIPVPFTGAWTGALCAFVFGIPFRKALIAIAGGVIIAGLIVTLTTLGIIKIL